MLQMARVAQWVWRRKAHSGVLCYMFIFLQGLYFQNKTLGGLVEAGVKHEP